LFSVFFLSLLSYYFVEKKFRNKNFISAKNFLILIFSLTFFFIIILLHTNKSNGFDNRFIIDNINVDNYSYSKRAINFQNQQKKDNFFIDSKKIKVLVVGNSHAEDMLMLFNNAPHLQEEYQFRLERIQIYDFFQKIKSKNYSKNFNEAEVILFSTQWFDNDLSIAQELINFIKILDKKIILTTNTPVFSVKNIKYKNINLMNMSIYSEFIIKNNKAPTKTDLQDLENKYFLDLENNKEFKKINYRLFDLANKNNIKILNKNDYICSYQNNSCIILTDNKDLIIYDQAHYSLEGATYLAKKIEELDWFKLH